MSLDAPVIKNCFYRVSVKALILNEKKDKFLVCYESAGFWELPGGGLEWGATPQEDLAREVKEEMGLRVVKVSTQPSYFLTGQQTLNANIKIANVVYECEVENLDFVPSYECTAIRFINKDDVKELKVSDGVAKLATMFKQELAKG